VVYRCDGSSHFLKEEKAVGVSSGAMTPKSKLVKNARINMGGKAGIIREESLDSEAAGLGEA